MTGTFRVVFAVTEVGDDAGAGDYFTAMELGQALQQRFGWLVEYRPRGISWYELEGVDLVVAMLEDYDLRAVKAAKPGLIKVGWARNWFEAWAAKPWLPDFDLLLASSTAAVRHLSLAAGKRARLLRLAGNPVRFQPPPVNALKPLDFVFTGSYWGAPRDVLTALVGLPSKYAGAIYGKNWGEHHELAHLDRGFVPYTNMPGVYAQTKIVIDDANHVTKDWGAANSRVFDALAAGCLVITNAASVSEECFGGLLPVYCDAKHLEALLDQYLKDVNQRNDLQNALRSKVLREHCYSHRAFEFGLHLKSLRLSTPPIGHMSVDALVVATTGQQQAAWTVPSGVEPVSALSAAPLVSIVVPLFNHLAETQAMLASLQASLADRHDWDLTLIDDGSTDGTREWLDNLELPRVRVLKNAGNQGFARTNNIAVAQCRGDVLVLANNDLVFGPGWLQPMLDVLLDPARQAGLVGNVQTRVEDGAIDHTGIDISLSGELVHLRTVPSDVGASAAVERFALTAACVAVRRENFLRLGGFDEAYTNGGEDVDLCFRAAAAGLRNWVALHSRVQHHVSLARGSVQVRDERNSAVLEGRWRSRLQARLGEVWLAAVNRSHTASLHVDSDLIRSGSGLLSSVVAGGGLSSRDQALSIAASVLQRNAYYRSHTLGQPLPSVDYAQATGGGEGVNMPLADYICPGPRMFVELPPGAGVKGVFLIGQLVGSQSNGDKWKVTLNFNGLQQVEFVLSEVDINIGLHQPLVWTDRSTRLRIDIEPLNVGIGSPGRIYLSHLYLDEGTVIPWRKIVRKSTQVGLGNNYEDVPSLESSLRLTANQWAALSPELFVQHAYWALLGRAADPGGFEGYLTALNAGLSRESLWAELASSDEAKQTLQKLGDHRLM